MAFEKGGRASKFGNRYERRYLLMLMVQVLQGGVKCIQSEPTGADEPGTDFLVEYPDGRKEYHQCKARNGDQENWSLESLEAHHIFQYIAKRVDCDGSRFVLVTPLHFQELEDLCLAARNTESEKVFLETQLTGKRKALFEKWAQKFGLGQTEAEREKAVAYLRGFVIGHFDDDDVTNRQWECMLGCMVTGNREDACDALMNYMEEDHLGEWTGCSALLGYLEKRGHRFRDLSADPSIPVQLRELNRQFGEWFQPIGGQLVETPEAGPLLQKLCSGKNLLLLGEAGAGKSGCVYALKAKLEAQNIPYLALSVDKKMPKGSSSAYGAELGLPASPVLCLGNQLAKGQRGVLLLDQLDSLRWATKTYEEALSVCKQLLEEVRAENLAKKTLLSVVLVTRKFDYENDAELHDLCEPAMQEEPWETAEIREWSDARVAELVGKPLYDAMLPTMQRILKRPCYLSIWKMLDEKEKVTALSTPAELMKTWNEQIYRHGRSAGLPEAQIKAFLDEMLELQQDAACVPEMAFGDELSTAKEFLISEGVLCRIGEGVAFTHQGMADYLSVASWLRAVLHGQKLTDLLPEYGEQTPEKRVRLQMFWQQLKTNQKCFFKTAENFLESPDVRYYYKCTVWEALGQEDAPDAATIKFVRRYWEQDVWKDQILNTVFRGHSGFIRQYVAAGFAPSWQEESAQQLLWGFAADHPAFVRAALGPYALQELALDRRLLQMLLLARDPEPATAELCLHILNAHPELLRESVGYEQWIVPCPEQAVEYLALVLDTGDPGGHSMDRAFMALAETAPHAVMEQICPRVAAYSKELNWYWHDAPRNPTNARFFVALVEKALCGLVQRDLPYVERFIESRMQTESWIEHEWILKLLLQLPECDAALAKRWLMADFPNHLLEKTSCEKQKTDCAARVLRKFSPLWPDAVFENVEQQIVSYTDPDILRYAKDQIRGCVEDPEKKPICWSYWGDFQEQLLPALDQTRTRTKALQAVLARRKEAGYSHGWYGKSGVTECYTVHSPIADHAEKLSDAAWVRLILQADRQTKDRCVWGIDSSPDAFARTFEKQMVEEPERLLRIADALPETIREPYAAAILRALTSKTVFAQLDFARVQALTEKFTRTLDPETQHERALTFCMLVENHPEVPWADASCSQLLRLAVERGETPEGSPEDTAQSVRQNARISVRELALHALAALLWEHPEKTGLWKEPLEPLLRDPVPEIRRKMVDVLSAMSGREKEWACEGFFVLLQQDVEILLEENAGWFVRTHYASHPAEYRSRLLEAFESRNTDLVWKASCTLARLSLRGEEPVRAALLERQCSGGQLDGIWQECAWEMKQGERKEEARALLLSLLQHCRKIPERALLEYRDAPQAMDAGILQLLADRCETKLAVNEMIRFFLAAGKRNIRAWRGILYGFCCRICAQEEADTLLFSEFYKLPFLLLSAAESEEEQQKVLDLFDAVFRRNLVRTDKFLSEANP